MGFQNRAQRRKAYDLVGLFVSYPDGFFLSIRYWPDHIHAGLEDSIPECILTDVADVALFAGAFRPYDI